MFAKGNQWARLKASPNIGTAKNYSNPQDLFDAACDYFRWCDENPIIDTVIGGKDARLVEVPKRRVYNLQGLAIHVGVYSKKLFDDYPLIPEFADVMKFIFDTIYSNKFEGAAAGMFHAGLITRDLGLVDKKEVEQNQRLQIRITIPDNGRRVLRSGQAEIEDADVSDL